MRVVPFSAMAYEDVLARTDFFGDALGLVVRKKSECLAEQTQDRSSLRTGTSPNVTSADAV